MVRECRRFKKGIAKQQRLGSKGRHIWWRCKGRSADSGNLAFPWQGGAKTPCRWSSRSDLCSTVPLRLKVGFQRHGNIVTDRALVDVVLFRIAQPQIGDDRVSVLIMAVPCTVIVRGTDFFGGGLKIGDTLRNILRVVVQVAEHLPHGFALSSRHGDQHAACEEMCGVQQTACLRQSLRQHVRKIRHINVPVLPKALDRFPFAAYAAVD